MSEVARRVSEFSFSLPEDFENYCLHVSRLAALGASSSAIMHEIGNALTVISGNAQILLLKGERATPEDIATRHRRIQDYVERIQACIDRVGSFSERTAGTVKKISPLRAVRNALFAVERRCSNLDIKIDADLNQERGQITCDPTLLEFLLIELISFFTNKKAASGKLVVTTGSKRKNWTLAIRYYPPPEKSLIDWDISKNSDTFSLPVVVHVADEVGVDLFSLEDDTYKGWKLILPMS